MGRELFYQDGGSLWALEIQTAPMLDWQDPTALFETGMYRTYAYTNYDVSPDGQTFIFVRPTDEEYTDRSRQIRVVLNWFEELKERVPVPERLRKM